MEETLSQTEFYLSSSIAATAAAACLSASCALTYLLTVNVIAKLKVMSARNPTVKRKNDEAIFVNSLYYNELMPRLTFPALFISILFAPLLSISAQAISAGFPVQPIWSSRSSAIEGESIDFYAAVYNGSSESIKGNVVFYVDGKSLGSELFDLSPGKAELVSIVWKAEAGVHIISAKIESKLAVVNNRSGDLSITVAKAPPPTRLEQGVKVVGTVAKDVASTSIPIISSVAKTVLQATESFRESGIEFAEEQLSKQPPSAPASAKNSGQSKAGTTSSTTAQTDVSADKQQDDSFFSRLSQLAAPAILFAFGNRPIFYFLLVLLLLGLLYLLGRMVNKPRY